MTLEQLIHDPDATAQAILEATDDPQEIMDAAAIAFAQVEQASDAAELALVAHEAALAKSKACAGMPGSDERIAQMLSTGQQAAAAVAKAQAALESYGPWQEALARIEAAMKVAKIIESN